MPRFVAKQRKNRPYRPYLMRKITQPLKNRTLQIGVKPHATTVLAGRECSRDGKILPNGDIACARDGVKILAAASREIAARARPAPWRDAPKPEPVNLSS